MDPKQSSDGPDKTDGSDEAEDRRVPSNDRSQLVPISGPMLGDHAENRDATTGATSDPEPAGESPPVEDAVAPLRSFQVARQVISSRSRRLPRGRRVGSLNFRCQHPRHDWDKVPGRIPRRASGRRPDSVTRKQAVDDWLHRA